MTQMFGDWDAAEKFLSKLADHIEDTIKLTNIQNARDVEAALVSHIQHQDLGWPALDPIYKRQKKQKGLSTNIMIATSTLMNSITIKVIDDGAEVFVGVLRKTRAKNGSPAVLIAAVHEFGSSKRSIPPRPLFRPTLTEKKEVMVKRLKVNLQNMIAKFT